MKTYSGELKKGMPCERDVLGQLVSYRYEAWSKIPERVYVFNKETGECEWQHYEPEDAL